MEEAKDFTKIYGLAATPVSAQIIGDTNAKINYIQDQNGNLTLSFANTQFDKDVTVVQLNFNEPVKTTNKITDPAPALQSLLENADAKKSAYEIANQLHKGTNLLDNTGITQDGMDMKIKNFQN
jgi:alpha-L-fucosidase